MPEILRTDRLRLRLITEDDAAFYLALVNDPAFIEYIGDRKLHSIEAARRGLCEGPIAMQAQYGHSMYLVELLEDGTPIGMSGLLKRDTLEYVDIGYAFLAQYRGRGYALEAGRALLRHAAQLGIRRLAAIVVPSNVASIGLLERLGMRYERNASVLPERPPLNVYLADLDG